MLVIALAELTIDLKIQPRAAGLTQDHADDMAAWLRENPKSDLPPVRVFRLPDSSHLLSRGFHRAEAYARAGRTHVPAEVVEGDFEAALLDAMASNQENTLLRRTNEDKRRAVAEVLKVKSEWSDRRIAEHVGVGADMVGTLRGQLSVNDSSPVRTSSRVGRDNKTRTVNPKPRRSKQKGNKPPPESNGKPVASAEPPDPALEFVAGVEAICFDLDQIAARMKELKQSRYGYSIHVDSAVSQVEAARKTLWQGRPAHPCPYCEANETDGCRACNGTRRVKKSTLENGREAVGGGK